MINSKKRRELILQRVVDRANPYEGEAWKRQRVAELMGRRSSQPEKPKIKQTPKKDPDPKPKDRKAFTLSEIRKFYNDVNTAIISRIKSNRFANVPGIQVR